MIVFKRQQRIFMTAEQMCFFNSIHKTCAFCALKSILYHARHESSLSELKAAFSVNLERTPERDLASVIISTLQGTADGCFFLFSSAQIREKDLAIGDRQNAQKNENEVSMTILSSCQFTSFERNNRKEIQGGGTGDGGLGCHNTRMPLKVLFSFFHVKAVISRRSCKIIPFQYGSGLSKTAGVIFV